MEQRPDGIEQLRRPQRPKLADPKRKPNTEGIVCCPESSWKICTKRGHQSSLQSFFKSRLLHILPELPPEIEGQDCEPGERSDRRPVQKESCECNQIKFNSGEFSFELE